MSTLTRLCPCEARPNTRMQPDRFARAIDERPDSKFIGAASEGWPMVISNLKSLLETGDVALVYHRGRGD